MAGGMSLAQSSVLATCPILNEMIAGGRQHQQSPQPSALQGTGFALSFAVPVISAAAEVVSTKSNSKAICLPLAFVMAFASPLAIIIIAILP